MSDATPFTDLNTLAAHLRQELENKKFILLYAHNGTGKTRLSTAFKELGKVVDTDDETEQGDTLYFNAFTEDLFSWDNDLENDSERKLTLNTDSRFFAGLESMEMDNRIRTPAQPLRRLRVPDRHQYLGGGLRPRIQGEEGRHRRGPGRKCGRGAG